MKSQIQNKKKKSGIVKLLILTKAYHEGTKNFLGKKV